MSTVTLEKRKLTPPQVSLIWGVSTEKILAFIRSGELKAMNAASPGRDQRPRYLIDIGDLADLERRRTVGSAPKMPPRRRWECGEGDEYY
jgi:hypothetical protein